jgi:hypothetical protein
MRGAIMKSSELLGKSIFALLMVLFAVVPRTHRLRRTA